MRKYNVLSISVTNHFHSVIHPFDNTFSILVTLINTFRPDLLQAYKVLLIFFEVAYLFFMKYYSVLSSWCHWVQDILWYAILHYPSLMHSSISYRAINSMKSFIQCTFVSRVIKMAVFYVYCANTKNIFFSLKQANFDKKNSLLV